MALEDVGPAGVDKGKGGKYLILPPGYKGEVPDGYISLPSQTYTGFALLRSNLKSGSDSDIAKAVAYGKRVKFYPLSQAANPPETKFVDANSLETIGIEKGKPFNPDEKTEEIMNDAAHEAHARLDYRYEGIFSPPFNEGTHCCRPRRVWPKV